ncbi:hypothetical protein E2C01_091050 [Portunus trituberculatus]|uniref:Uncharacterized protein n=1 Tax=Portunus trituberculatus TaxID=210409 RepID=A0A5B7JI62_PORTR|nr:hypothetical protein [Portunus trituberculatus]
MVIQWDEPETPNGQITVSFPFFITRMFVMLPMDFILN